ncbi:MAG TPA: FRG domain-containing protein [Cellvibrionaceae bacterium]
MDNNEEKNIESLQDFIFWLKELQEKNPGQEYFFRGHSKLSYKLVPNVYRENSIGRSFRENERDMYHEMLNRVPQEFNPNDVFGNLVKMQHFGIPTRLLDITKNALVALYFSVANSVDEGGRIYGFNVGADEVFFPEDIPVLGKWFPKYKELRGTYELLGMDFWDNFMNILVFGLLNFMKTNSDELCFERQQVRVALTRLTNGRHVWDMDAFESFTTIARNLFDLMDDTPVEHMFGEVIRSVELEFEMPQTRYYFSKWWDIMVRPMFVVAPMNNMRVQSQQGAFILFPPHPYSVRKDFFEGGTGFGVASARVGANVKSGIKKELECLGVSESALFPEIDKIADFVKNKYIRPLAGL